MQLTKDGKTLITAGADGTIRFWDASGDFQTATDQIDAEGLQTMLLWPDERWLVTGGQDATIRFWNLETKQVEKTFQHSAPVRRLVLSPMGVGWADVCPIGRDSCQFSRSELCKL